MMIEGLVIASLMLIGALTIRSCGIDSRGLTLVLSVPAACAVIVLIGTTLIVLGIPIAVPPVLIGTSLGLLGLVTMRNRLNRSDVLFLSLAAAGGMLIAATVHGRALVQLTVDSFEYLTIGAILAEDGGVSVIPFDRLQRRGVAYPMLLSLGHLGNDYYLHSLAPVIAVSTIGLLVWLTWKALSGLRSTTRTVACAMGALLLVTNHRFVFNAWYLNSHMLFAAWLLAAIGLLWLHNAGRYRVSSGIVLVVLPALALLRPEAGLTALVAVVPALASDRFSERFKGLLIGTIGLAVVAWHVRIVLQAGGKAGIETWGMIGVGLLAVVVGGLLNARVVVIPQWTPAAGVAVLSLTVLVLAFWDGGIIRASIDATLQNQVGGAGLYGSSLIVLALLSLGVLGWRRFPGMQMFVVPLVAALPLGLLLAVLRGTAYRVGPGDSLNRMLFHWLPLAILAVVAAIDSQPSWRRMADRGKHKREVSTVSQTVSDEPRSLDSVADLET